MDLVRWRPFRDLATMQEEMNRLFDHMFNRLPEAKDFGEGMWSPCVDISETKDNLVITAEVPGMKKDDIRISVHDNILTLRGEKKQEKKVDEENYHRIERSYGAFHRSFTLPTTVQQDQVKASYKDGILRITLPKAEEAKPKEIAIEVK